MDYLFSHPEERASDLKKAFLDDSIKGIICATGGDDTYKTIPYLMEDKEFLEAVKKHPKIFTGYSDTTMNHLMLNKIGLETFYGPCFLTDLAELEKDVSAALLLAPDSILAKELISIVWYNNKHWQNTIAILENIQDGYILSEAERYFILAWCNSKIRRKKESIEYYQKCLENEPMKPWARNNLAYELYLTKQYKQAEKEYRFCIDNKIDLKYACSGYVRTLAALGKFDEADSFIKITPEKIYKNALDIIEKKTLRKPTSIIIFCRCVTSFANNGQSRFFVPVRGERASP